MAAMFGVPVREVAESPISRALAALPNADVHAGGVRLDRAEYVRQYVMGVRQRMLRLVPSSLDTSTQ